MGVALYLQEMMGETMCQRSRGAWKNGLRPQEGFLAHDSECGVE